MWAVGDGVYRWNGTTWSTFSSTLRVDGLWGSSATNIYFGGDGFIFWNGTKMDFVDTSFAGTTFGTVWGLPSGEAWAAGYGGELIHHAP